MIYVIEASGLGFVKFGVARNPSQRLSDLQVGCPVELRLLASAPMSGWAEKFIHEIFTDEWVRGEWFKKSDRVNHFIGLLQQAATNEDVLACCAAYLRAQAEESANGRWMFNEAVRRSVHQCGCDDQSWCKFTTALFSPSPEVR